MLVVFPTVGTSWAKDLVAYYQFNGDAKDVSGNGHDGVLIGNAKLVKNDGAPVPDGKGCLQTARETGNGVDCGESPSLRIQVNFTLMAWAKPDDVTATQYIAGTPYDDEAAWDAPWTGHNIGVTGGQMIAWLNLNGQYKDFRGGAPEVGKWQHFAFTFDGQQGLAYINGEEVTRAKLEGKVKFSGKPHFMIGERSITAPGEPFGGLIDEVALFKMVLTEEEIKNFMQNGIPLALEPGGKLTMTWGNLKRLR
jgi:hypothetical protein